MFYKLKYAYKNMKTNSQLRRQARFGLEGNWGMMALCHLLIILMIYVLMLPVEAGAAISAIKGGSAAGTNTLFADVWQILVVLALLPASWMLSVMCLRLVRGDYGQKQVRLGEVFEGYRYTNRVVVTYLTVVLVATAIMILPLVITVACCADTITRFSNTKDPALFGQIMVALIPFLTIYEIVYLRLCLYSFLLWDTNLGAFAVLKESNRMMKGRCWKMFCLWLSFIGWAILAIFTLGIGLLWLQPYITASMGAFYDDIRAEEAAAAVEPESVEEQPAALDVEPQDQE